MLKFEERKTVAYLVTITGQEERLDPEMKEYRMMTGKVSRLAQSARPDMSFSALYMAKKSNSTTLSDLRYVNNILER